MEKGRRAAANGFATDTIVNRWQGGRKQFGLARETRERTRKEEAEKIAT